MHRCQSKELDDGTDDQANLEQAEKAAGTYTRSMPESEVQNLFVRAPVFRENVPTVRRKRIGSIPAHRRTPEVLAPIRMPDVQ